MLHLAALVLGVGLLLQMCFAADAFQPLKRGQVVCKGVSTDNFVIRGIRHKGEDSAAALQSFLRQFTGFMPFLIELAAIISLAVQVSFCSSVSGTYLLW